MVCCCCTCAHCVHPPATVPFTPYHHPPSIPIEANTLLLPSTASALDAPLHLTTRKRSFGSSRNSTSPALIEALHWEGEEEDHTSSTDHRPPRPTPSSPSHPPPSNSRSTRPPHCTCDCHLQAETSHVQPPSSPVEAKRPRPGTSSRPPASPARSRPRTGTSTTSSPTSPRMKQRPVTSPSSTSSKWQFPFPSSETVIWKGGPPSSSTQTAHDMSAEEARRKMEEEDALRTAERDARRAELSAHWEADKAHKSALHTQYEAEAERRQRQGRADDIYYAAMLKRQYERRLRMQHWQAKAERERAEKKLRKAGKLNKDSSNDLIASLQGKPVFCDFGGLSQSHVEGEKRKTFNIIPDLPPNHPPSPQSYPTARLAAVQRLQQKQSVEGEVRRQLAEQGEAFYREPTVILQQLKALTAPSASASPRRAQTEKVQKRISAVESPRPRPLSGVSHYHLGDVSSSEASLISSLSSFRPPSIQSRSWTGK